ncbi:hypothetical protein [Halococcus sp. PRR34]|uniref:hypothetical protein n=1 Tax=Halococcus sp. PRR34 TaxID=3020830 RepID=UPI00235EBAF1|nr:hypothetical protein [Halococcus sp. PRR34]
MPVITSDRVLEDVEHILSSGSGVLDFAVSSEDEYYTWWGTEKSNWEISGVGHIENAEEDRMAIYPIGDAFYCEISADGEEFNTGPVKCVSEESKESTSA